MRKPDSHTCPCSRFCNFKMVKFQSRNLGDDILGSEKMKITPLGAGSEVGRSCIVVEFKGKTIMVISKSNKSIIILPFPLL